MKVRTIAISQLALATALLTLDAVPALAQAATVVEDTGIIEDIVVTAQRRRERAQDVLAGNRHKASNWRGSKLRT